MNLLQILAGSSSGGGTSVKTYADDVFATHLYTGNNNIKTINNGIELGSNWHIPNPTVQSFSNGLLLMPFDTGTTVSEKLGATYSGLRTPSAFSPNIFGSLKTGIKLTGGGSGFYYGTAAMTIGTIEYWFYGKTGSNYPMCNINATSASSYSSLALASGNYYSSNNGTSWDVSGSLSVLPVLDRWNHIAISWGSGIYRVFVNGVLAATINQANSPFGSMVFPLQYNTGNYQNGFSNLLISSTNKYISNFTVPNGPFTYSGIDTSLGYSAGSGGLIWTKARNSGGSNVLVDTVRGFNKPIYSESSNGESTSGAGGDITGFTSTGYTLGPHSTASVNYTWDYVSWTFRKAAKFFDIVSYTGSGVARDIPHSLGISPGFIVIKRIDASAHDWQVYHRSLANTEHLVLNSSAAKVTGSSRWNNTSPTSSVFSLDGDATVNVSGGSYIAYIFAHNSNADGLIQCGAFITDGSGNSSINLGFEPQMLIIKGTDAANWFIFDTARGLTNNSSGNMRLYANSSATESDSSTIIDITTNGFNVKNNGFGTSKELIYMAIRRPNKPPTIGTQVFSAVARTGTSSSVTVLTTNKPDLVISRSLFNNGGNGGLNARAAEVYDRLRGREKVMTTTTPSAESLNSGSLVGFDVQNGFVLGADPNNGINGGGNPDTYIDYIFTRYPGVFDMIVYKGVSGGTTVTHNLASTPELVITKGRNTTIDWAVSGLTMGNNELYLNSTNAYSVVTQPGGTPTTWTLRSGMSNPANEYISYLFASKAGISKIGTYVGNGSSQTIDCGFAAGARFLLIKRTDSGSNGDWFVFDTTRGIVAGNDPVFPLNTVIAPDQYIGDHVDPASSGFIVNQVAVTNINVNAATYLYLAIA